MRQAIVMHLLKMRCLSSLVLVGMIVILSACGGGKGHSTTTSSFSSSNLLSSSASSVISTVNITGTITYDYVPHNLNHIGLNYSAIEQRPVRGAVVELVDGAGQIKAATTSNADGLFLIAVAKNISVKVRVKAQLLNTSAPTWDFKVTDNTSNNALYVLDGALASTGTTNSTRNLNAGFGWDGFSYSSVRSAAPFAILDDIYIGVKRVIDAGNTQNLSPLELHWSTKNSTADGDYSKGEIGTSFYDGSAIYILGDANNDTDEYDSHVLLHEWGHYIEDELFRSDSIGGDHSDGEFLDIRLAMSEGFANAFSGMMNNDANYSDASDTAQSSGFTFNVSKKNRSNKGYFSEGSVGSIFYNFYTSNENKTANDFTPIFKVLSDVGYYANDAFTSIYLFHSQLKSQFSQYASLLETLMQEQAIWGVDEYGVNESNSGGLAIQLPIYKKVDANNIPINVCSSNQYGEKNKLGNSQFVKLNIVQPGFYHINITKSGMDNIISKPEFVLYLKGEQITYAANAINDAVLSSTNLETGNYVIEVYDLNHYDGENTDIKNTTCFDIRVAAN